MSFNESIGNHPEEDNKRPETKRGSKRLYLYGIGVGLAVGLAGGTYLGNAIQQNTELFQRAPINVRQSVIVSSALECSSAGGVIGGAVVYFSRRRHKSSEKF